MYRCRFFFPAQWYIAFLSPFPVILIPLFPAFPFSFPFVAASFFSFCPSGSCISPIPNWRSYSGARDSLQGSGTFDGFGNAWLSACLAYYSLAHLMHFLCILILSRQHFRLVTSASASASAFSVQHFSILASGFRQNSQYGKEKRNEGAHACDLIWKVNRLMEMEKLSLLLRAA